MLRGFLPRSELDHLLSRMAQLTVRIFSCRFPANVTKSNMKSTRAARSLRVNNNSDPFCRELNELSGMQRGQHAAVAYYWALVVLFIEGGVV